MHLKNSLHVENHNIIKIGKIIADLTNHWKITNTTAYNIIIINLNFSLSLRKHNKIFIARILIVNL